MPADVQVDSAQHGLRPRDVDIDELLGRAGGLLRTGTSITLAVVGNALKAFPGFGTLGLTSLRWGLLPDGHEIGKPKPVFPRIVIEEPELPV